MQYRNLVDIIVNKYYWHFVRIYLYNLPILLSLTNKCECLSDIYRKNGINMIEFSIVSLLDITDYDIEWIFCVCTYIYIYSLWFMSLYMYVYKGRWIYLRVLTTCTYVYCINWDIEYYWSMKILFTQYVGIDIIPRLYMFVGYIIFYIYFHLWIEQILKFCYYIWCNFESFFIWFRIMLV